MSYLVTVTSKRQITLPKELMDVLGVEKGDKLIARKHGKKIAIEAKGKGVLNMIGKFGDLHVPKGKTIDDLVNEAVLESTKNVFP